MLDDLQLDALNADFAAHPREHVVSAMLRAPDLGPVTVVTSFGADSSVLLNLVARADPATAVVFIDTGMHFAQTLAYRDQLVAHLGLTNVRNVAPQAQILAKQDPAGALWLRNADACCSLRKVAPLEEALAGVQTWMNGRKTFQSSTRMQLKLVERVDGRLKLNPLANWSAADLAADRLTHDLPAHPLVQQGYLSIGCRPCTSPVRPGEPSRAGRWRHSEKIECGIHGSHQGSFI